MSIQELYGLAREEESVEAILERNKQGKNKKVCKVIVVGEARTGKTSLVRSLNNQPFDEHQSITNVIEISDFTPTSKQSLDNNNEVEMKIFDFGGQEIFNFIHPLFQSSQQCIVILVVNQCTQSFERMKEQIEFLQNFHQSDILVVSTSFCEQEQGNRKIRIDSDRWLNERDIEGLGIGKGRFVAISNKERKGIEQVVTAMQEMSKLRTIGWSLSDRGDCLRQHLTSMQEKHPVICDIKGKLATGCHNHPDTFEKDLMLLEKSGWIFSHGNASISVIQKNLIVKMLQGLFTIDMHFKKGVLSTSLLVNGMISEADFKRYFEKLCQPISRNAADESKMQESWEIVADLISRFSICHRISNRRSKGIMPYILFPSLLPTFINSDQTMWDNLNVKEKAKKGVTRKLIVAGKYGDKRKVMDFIFPRLMIKMWNEVVDVKLCCQDTFVVRGDATPDDFSQEVGNMKNLMIVSRTDNEAIKLERVGNCFGRIIFRIFWRKKQSITRM